jgi:hypothetical protein
MTATQLVPAIIVPLLAWRVYRRYRRNVGRQHYTARRNAVRIGFFALLATGVGLACLAYPPSLAGLAGGLLTGAALAWLGVRLTKFEPNHRDGHYYTPNTYLGVGLTLLLAGRITYRIFQLYLAPSLANPAAGVFHSPLTLYILGVTSGYYIAYYTGLALHFRRAGQ